MNRVRRETFLYLGDMKMNLLSLNLSLGIITLLASSFPNVALLQNTGGADIQTGTQQKTEITKDTSENVVALTPMSIVATRKEAELPSSISKPSSKLYSNISTGNIDAKDSVLTASFTHVDFKNVTDTSTPDLIPAQELDEIGQ
jgi:hypothetical protein